MTDGTSDLHAAPAPEPNRSRARMSRSEFIRLLGIDDDPTS
jgi:hypothetical protein